MYVYSCQTKCMNTVVKKKCMSTVVEKNVWAQLSNKMYEYSCRTKCMSTVVEQKCMSTVVEQKCMRIRIGKTSEIFFRREIDSDEQYLVLNGMINNYWTKILKCIFWKYNN